MWFRDYDYSKFFTTFLYTKIIQTIDLKILIHFILVQKLNLKNFMLKIIFKREKNFVSQFPLRFSRFQISRI